MVVLKKVFLLYVLLAIPTKLVCCCNCCNCCNCRGGDNEPDVITEEDIREAERNYTEPEEVDITTEGVLIHLKLDGNKLDNIVTDVNKYVDNIAKINKIIEYTADIDWARPMCPNSLMRWEKNECSYISYFHLMINSPYFVKFFLICDKIDSLHREDTYVLNAMCEVVRWCVNNPKFDKNNMGSVDPVLVALFKKIDDTDEYFYCKKDNQNSTLGLFFYGIEEATTVQEDETINGEEEESLNGVGDAAVKVGEALKGDTKVKRKATKYCLEPYEYGGFLPTTVYEEVNSCLLYVDFHLLGIHNEITKKITKIVCPYISPWNPHIDEYSMGRLLKYKTCPPPIANILSSGVSSSIIGTLPQKVLNMVYYEQEKNSSNRKLLGMALYQYSYHSLNLTNYNGVWYNKNTLTAKHVKKMPIRKVLRLLNKIFKAYNKYLKTKTWNKGDWYMEHCLLWYLDDLN